MLYREVVDDVSVLLFLVSVLLYTVRHQPGPFAILSLSLSLSLYATLQEKLEMRHVHRLLYFSQVRMDKVHGSAAQPSQSSPVPAAGGQVAQIVL